MPDNVFVRTVCDAAGNNEKDGTSRASSYYGKHVAADNIGYQFYVPSEAVGSNVTQVNMIVPMGGPQSGLFRFPRVGEQVLICRVEGNESYYLLGFVPTASAPFYPEGAQKNMTLTEALDAYKDPKTSPEKKERLANYIATGPAQRNPGNMDDFLNDNGMALRYKKESVNKNQPMECVIDVTGKKDPTQMREQKIEGKGPFSEVGFYNKKAKWPDVSKENKEMGAPLPEDRFSRIDVLNIQSTGDIESRAENYHLLKAKRIEFLSNADEVSPEMRADNCRDDYSDWTSDQAPLVDAPLDDSAVHGGDMHFRAGKNVIIKALGEIRLQVGRTILVINDDGFSAVTRKVNSNIPVPSDTSFNMKARDGISMFGESVDIASARKFGLSDTWGASIGSMVGRLNISGQQINQKTYDKVQQGWATVFNGITLAQNTIIGGMATNPDMSAVAGWTNYSIDVVRFLAECGRDVMGIIKTYETYEKNANALREQRRAAIAASMNIPPDLIADRNGLEYGELSQMEADEPNPLPATDALDAASAMVGAEPIECLMAALDLVLAITAVVYTTAEQVAAIQQRQDLFGAIFDGETKYWDAQKKSAFKNTLNLCAMCIDGGLIETAMVGNLLKIDMGGPAGIQLRQAGDIVIKAGKQKGLYAELKQDVAVPVAVAVRKAAANVRSGLAAMELISGFDKLVFKTESFDNRFPAYLERL
jgi:hypothetical protein